MIVRRREASECLIVELTEREELMLQLKHSSAMGWEISVHKRSYPTWADGGFWLGEEKYKSTRQRLAWLTKEVAESYEGYKPVWLEELVT